MSQRFRLFLGVLVVFLFGYVLNEFVVSSFFVKTLEQNRISIYFVKDCVLAFFAVNFLALLFFYSVRENVKKDEIRQYGYDFFLYFFVFVLIFRFVLDDNYPNVSRREIGYFYKIPAGQTITYPKYPRGIESDN